MARQASLKTKLAALLKAEKAKQKTKRDKLEKKRAKLLGQVDQIDKQLADMDAQLGAEVSDSLRALGITVAPGGGPRKAGAGRKRKARGSNTKWILEQVGKTALTRAELLEKAKQAGLKPASVSQALFSMAKSGQIAKTGKGRKATYKAKG